MSYGPSTAFLVVDVQNDFADPAGNLYVRGGEEVVPVINAETHRAAAAGGLVVYTQDWHPPTTPHFEKDGGIWPVLCVQDSWGAQLHPELRVLGERVRKGAGGEDGYSGFSVRHPETGRTDSTNLEDLLRARGIETVVIAGLATDYCVKETALDAARKGFTTIVVNDGVRAVDLEPGDGDRALARMRQAGVQIL